MRLLLIVTNPFEASHPRQAHQGSDSKRDARSKLDSFADR
jgi:hypothetical protein